MLPQLPPPSNAGRRTTSFLWRASPYVALAAVLLSLLLPGHAKGFALAVTGLAAGLAMLVTQVVKLRAGLGAARAALRAQRAAPLAAAFILGLVLAVPIVAFIYWVLRPAEA